MKWQPAETAPRTGAVFLADMGWPWACLVCWNPAMQQWVCAMQSANICNGEDDPYFENEYEKPAELQRWMPLPDL